MLMVIWSMGAVIFLLIGFGSRRAQKPVGFFTFVEPPSVKNVAGYNHAVSCLWFCGAAVFEIIGIPCFFAKQNSPVIVFVIPGVLVWAIAMMIAYMKIEAKFKA